MPTTTTNLALRIPADADAADAPVSLGNLANDIDGLYGAWTSFSGTITVSQPGSLTKTVTVARGRKRGKDWEFEISLTNFGAGTGATAIVIGGLPFTAQANGFLAVGVARLTDTSAATSYDGATMLRSGSNNTLSIGLAGGEAGVATMTAALAAADFIYMRGKMEVT
jgi:hypothetical protein